MGIARRAPTTWIAAWRPTRDLAAPLRVVAFAALAAYVGAAWIGMVVDPPAGRAALVVGVMTAAAAALTFLGQRRLPRAASQPLAAVIGLLAIALGAMAMGVPARVILPWHWGELAANLGSGLDGLWSVDYPYSGSTGWTRLALLLGLPAVLAVAVALAFWPTRRAQPALRTSALVILMVAYGAATTVAPPSDPLLRGLCLLLLVWAWLWLPGHGLRQGLLGAGLILVAGLLALPVAAALSGGRPWVDYRNWGVSHEVGPTESFTWDQAYGPLTWPRVGRRMLHVQSNAPYYWRAAVLDEFDGTSWVQSDSSGTGALQLPPRVPGSAGPRLNPDWIHDLTYTVDRLRSDLVVAAGTPLTPPRLEGLTVMERGLLLPSDQALGEGDSYTVRSYVPDPTLAQMRHAPEQYPAALERDTEVTLPGGRSVTVPLWGAPPSGAADRALAESAYGGVYALARRVTAGKSTPYGAVKAIESYLGAHYGYSEFAPITRLALRAFLLRIRHGYCQHFSGAMALMLRMLGIPARVAAGFSPGRAESGNYVVTDFDSHSWVEVYFSGIGWVTFDPTPPGAPAHSRTSGLGAPIAAPASEAGDLRERGSKASSEPGSARSRHSEASASFPPFLASWIWAPILAGLLAGGLALRRRAVRRRAPGGADAPLREVTEALKRVRSWNVRGSTLLALERRLEAEVGPGSAAYLAKLRAIRYVPGQHPPPAPSDRRVLRRELSAGLGLRGRLRGLLAIPPRRPAVPRPRG